MESKKKILFFIVTTLLLGTITFLIIRNTEKKAFEKENEQNKQEPQVVEAVVENINYEKYLELRSKAHDTEKRRFGCGSTLTGKSQAKD